ncbi:hypothetical protein KQ51_00341 [Candidatus Izimaplasma bacterium HR1]|jgi:hypothetical protein|uniref:hypothetical protein n=1 Tax=Candidatus Izimoplasma sp. HR1 TaxID=1541959 RepID=UPI0004F87AB9|nr:hypothetical protein KQ51_00341 [Candidatus Izimaplasma bacterium HR1]
MDSFILKDYASWKIENHEMIEKFKGNNNVIYQRLEPVFLVLDYVYDLACDQQELDEDLETIFEIGFNYINAQFNVIKIYFESLFQSKCDEFEDYSEMLLFLIYIFDFRTDLENHGFESDIEVLNDAETYIENMIMERRRDYDYVRDMLNEALKNVSETIDYEYVSLIDIYVEIAENFGIYVFENDEFVVGKEI